MRLAQLGHYKLALGEKVDNQKSTKLKTALKRFQRKRGLEVTAKVDEPTIEALKVNQPVYFERISTTKLDSKDPDTLFIGLPRNGGIVSATKDDAIVLEFEDTLFNHSSAVLLPQGVTAPDQEDDKSLANQDQKSLSGLTALAAVFKYLHTQANKTKPTPKELLIAGHTDTSGNDSYNAKLSKLRADSVFYLLIGGDSREDWIAQCNAEKKNGVKTSRNRDVKEIVNWASSLPFEEVNNETPFDYSLMAVNDDMGKKEEAVIEGFQHGYNLVLGQLFPVLEIKEKEDKEISVDGDVGKQTWGAIFDIYQWELERQVEDAFKKDSETGSVLPMDKLRELLIWAGPDNDPEKARLGCGESHPIDEHSKDDYRSQTNRRVEIMFFELDSGLELACQKGKCKKDNCVIYPSSKCEKYYITSDGSDVVKDNTLFVSWPEYLTEYLPPDLVLRFETPNPIEIPWAIAETENENRVFVLEGVAPGAKISIYAVTGGETTQLWDNQPVDEKDNPPTWVYMLKDLFEEEDDDDDEDDDDGESGSLSDPDEPGPDYPDYS